MATRFQEALQPTIQEVIDTFDIPGFAVIAARSGKPVERCVVGADAAGAPLNDDSIFPIASIGKLAVALAVLRLGDGIIGFLEWPRCPWGLGPELYGAKTPHWAPPGAGADSFGHAGGSGCIAWVAPSDGIAWSIHGTRHFSTWLVQRGPIIGAAILAALRE